MKSERSTGRCSVCRVYKPLTADGNLKLHKRHEQTCDGSCKPPIVPSTKTPSWSKIREGILERDDRKCRKCYAPDDLEAHHKHERAFGGNDDPDNLTTLCGSCHMEWTFCEPTKAITFELWLLLPPARYLIVAFASSWPDNLTAAAFQQELTLMFARAMDQRNKAVK